MNTIWTLFVGLIAIIAAMMALGLLAMFATLPFLWVFIVFWVIILYRLLPKSFGVFGVSLAVIGVCVYFVISFLSIFVCQPIHYLMKTALAIVAVLIMLKGKPRWLWSVVALVFVGSMKNRVLELTQGLKVYFKNNWDTWVSIWNEICKNTDYMQLLYSVNPGKNAWGLNEKMICNVLGIFLEMNKDIELAISTANDLLTPKKNRRDYISNHGRNGGSSAVFSEEQHTRIENIIKSKING